MAELNEICERLLLDSNALAILLIDHDRQVIVRAGQAERIDATRLSSLLADNDARLLIEKEFSGQIHGDEKTNIHVSLVAQRVILAVIFDVQSSLGLVRLRVKKAGDELARRLERGPSGSDGPPPSAAAPAQVHAFKPDR